MPPAPRSPVVPVPSSRVCPCMARLCFYRSRGAPCPSPGLPLCTPVPGPPLHHLPGPMHPVALVSGSPVALRSGLLRAHPSRSPPGLPVTSSPVAPLCAGLPQDPPSQADPWPPVSSYPVVRPSGLRHSPPCRATPLPTLPGSPMHRSRVPPRLTVTESPVPRSRHVPGSPEPPRPEHPRAPVQGTPLASVPGSPKSPRPGGRPWHNSRRGSPCPVVQRSLFAPFGPPPWPRVPSTSVSVQAPP